MCFKYEEEYNGPCWDYLEGAPERIAQSVVRRFTARILFLGYWLCIMMLR